MLTSVHLPPKGRKGARDGQLAALLRNYAAVDTSEFRLGLPFAPNKEVKRSPTHVLAGDFNVFPGSVDDDGTEDYGMTAAGFVAKIPQNAATSAGGQHYDNFLVNKASDERLHPWERLDRILMTPQMWILLRQPGRVGRP